jgi:hypothetical protein
MKREGHVAWKGGGKGRVAVAGSYVSTPILGITNHGAGQ